MEVCSIRPILQDSSNATLTSRLTVCTCTSVCLTVMVWERFRYKAVFLRIPLALSVLWSADAEAKRESGVSLSWIWAEGERCEKHRSGCRLLSLTAERVWYNHVITVEDSSGKACESGPPESSAGCLQMSHHVL